MSRSERLLDLLQILRRHRAPATGQVLADALGVSLRTLYRDIATLQGQGADIVGEAGLGYVLRPGFLLPPLMFSEDEVEALVLGARWVARRGDPPLAAAAADVLAKIEAVLPPARRDELDSSGLLVGPGGEDGADMTLVRRAIRLERKVEIGYRDRGDAPSRRTIWPIALTHFDRARVVVAWCELRGDFRHFRADRIASITPLDARYPKRRLALVRAWKAALGIAAAGI
ncbi:MAG: YafY family protein [Amaricoccus sp.]|uniref:helix-turn-helix transcriptional regulator n=1 Tax=Amaricoccus sp. TaxID=1872485 RepID=UPI0039E57E7B